MIGGRFEAQAGGYGCNRFKQMILAAGLHHKPDSGQPRQIRSRSPPIGPVVGALEEYLEPANSLDAFLVFRIPGRTYRSMFAHQDQARCWPGRRRHAVPHPRHRIGPRPAASHVRFGCVEGQSRQGLSRARDGFGNQNHDIGPRRERDQGAGEVADQGLESRFRRQDRVAPFSLARRTRSHGLPSRQGHGRHQKSQGNSNQKFEKSEPSATSRRAGPLR